MAPSTSHGQVFTGRQFRRRHDRRWRELAPDGGKALTRTRRKNLDIVLAPWATPGSARHRPIAQAAKPHGRHSILPGSPHITGGSLLFGDCRKRAAAFAPAPFDMVRKHGISRA